MRLKEVTVQNFLSFGSTPQCVELRKIRDSDFAFVTGSHNSGKSNFLRALRFIVAHIPNPVRTSEMLTPHWDTTTPDASVILSAVFSVAPDERQFFIDAYLLTTMEFPLPVAYDEANWDDYLDAVAQFWTSFLEVRSRLMSEKLFGTITFTYSSDSQEVGLLDLSATTTLRNRPVRIERGLQFLRASLRAPTFADEIHITESRIHRPVTMNDLLQSLADLLAQERRVAQQTGTLSDGKDTKHGRKIKIRHQRAGPDPDELKRLLRSTSRMLSDLHLDLREFSLLNLICASAKHSVSFLPQDRGLFKSMSALPFEITFDRAREVLYNLKFSSQEADRERFSKINELMRQTLGCSVEFMKIDAISHDLQLVFTEDNKSLYSVHDIFGAAYDLCAVFVAMYACNAETIVLDEPGRGSFANLRSDLRELLLALPSKSVVVVSNEFDILPTQIRPFQCVWRTTRDGPHTVCVDVEKVVDSLRLARFALDPSRRMLLFSPGVFMVEGVSDVRTLRAIDFILKSSPTEAKGGWSRCLGIKLDIMPLGGKSNSLNGMRLVQEFHIKGVVMMDWDAVIRRPFPTDRLMSDSRVQDILHDAEDILRTFMQHHNGNGTASTFASFSSHLDLSSEDKTTEPDSTGHMRVIPFARVPSTLDAVGSGKTPTTAIRSPCDSEEFQLAAERILMAINNFNTVAQGPKQVPVSDEEKLHIWHSIPNEIAFRVAREVMNVPEAKLKAYREFEPYSTEAVKSIRTMLSDAAVFVWPPGVDDLEGVMNYGRPEKGKFRKAEWADYSFDDDVRMVQEALVRQTAPDTPLMMLYEFLVAHDCLILADPELPMCRP